MPCAIGNRDYFIVGTCAQRCFDTKEILRSVAGSHRLGVPFWGNGRHEWLRLTPVFAANGCSGPGSGRNGLFGLPFRRMRRSLNLSPGDRQPKLLA